MIVCHGGAGLIAPERHERLRAGGIVYKRAGRVGDSPIPGAGTWADARCAISATGDGEAIVRVGLARGIAARIEAALPIEDAVFASLHELRAVTGGNAGVIAIDRLGWIARQWSPTMPIAWVDATGVGDSLGTVLE